MWTWAGVATGSGGSALAQVYGQVGNECPDVDDPELFGRAFDIVQELIATGLIASGHDRSDGGLVTTLLEMAFAGNCGIDVDLHTEDDDVDPVAVLFSEEAGLVMEVAPEHLDEVLASFAEADVPCVAIGRTLVEPEVRIRVGGRPVLEDDIRDLRDLWEATSFQLDRLQAEPGHVAAEEAGLRIRTTPPYKLTFDPKPTAAAILGRDNRFPVAILREEGSNGDREMAAAFHIAGFEPWDVTMSDLLSGRIDLDRFRGLAAVGGFSYADVLDSSKGWAGTIRFNVGLRRQFDAFYERPDTFSLGICNGCQLLPCSAGCRGEVWLVRTASLHPQRLWPFRVPFRHRRHPGESGSHVARHGRLDTRDLGPARGGSGVLSTALGPRSRDSRGLAPVRFVDDAGTATVTYPFNPNGSPQGIAGLCSPDGRHLAMMPHPERLFSDLAMAVDAVELGVAI